MANAIFLKIDGAPGTCTEANHKQWIEIDSYSFGANQQSSAAHGSGAGAGRVSFQDFHFTAKAGKESPVVFGMVCSGKVAPTVELHEVKAGGPANINHVEIVLSDCFICGFQMSDSAHAVEPQASYTLNFSKANFKYQAQKDDGSKDGGPVESGWDAKQNQKM
jgi:type VI secretion system secreted protein Hcp